MNLSVHCKFWGSHSCVPERSKSSAMLQYIVGQVVPIIFEDGGAFICKGQAGQENCWILKSEDTTVLQNIGDCWPDDMMSHSRRLGCWTFLFWEREVSWHQRASRSICVIRVLNAVTNVAYALASRYVLKTAVWHKHEDRKPSHPRNWLEGVHEAASWSSLCVASSVLQHSSP